MTHRFIGWIAAATGLFAAHASSAIAQSPTFLPLTCDSLDLTCSAESLADGLGFAYGFADITGDLGTTSSLSSILGSAYANDSAFSGGPGLAYGVSGLGDGFGSAFGEAFVEGDAGTIGSVSAIVGFAYSNDASFAGGSGFAASLSAVADALGFADGQAAVAGATGGSTSSASVILGATYSNDSAFSGDSGSASSTSGVDDGTGFAEGQAVVAGATSGSTSSLSAIDGAIYRNDAVFEGGSGAATSGSGIMTADGLVSSSIGVEGSAGSTYSVSGIDGGGLPFTDSGGQADSSTLTVDSSIATPIGQAYSASAFDGSGGTAFSNSGIDGAFIFSDTGAAIDLGTAYSLSGVEDTSVAAFGVSRVEGTAGATASHSRTDGTDFVSETSGEVGAGTAVSLSEIAAEGRHFFGASDAEGADVATSSASKLEGATGTIYSITSFTGDVGTALSGGHVGGVQGFAAIEAAGDTSVHFAEIDAEAISDEGYFAVTIDSVVKVAPGTAETYSFIGIEGVSAVVSDVPGGFAGAAATLNQSLVGNNVHDSGGSRLSAIEDSVHGTQGIVSLNQSSGDVNNQANVRSLALIGGPGVQIHGIDAKVETRDNVLSGVSGPREDRIYNSFSGSAGIVGVNQSAGNLNQMANVLVLGLSLGTDYATLGDSSLATVSAGNSAPADEPLASRKDVIAGDSFRDFVGIGQIIQSAGDLNIINHTMVVSVSGLGGGS